MWSNRRNAGIAIALASGLGLAGGTAADAADRRSFYRKPAPHAPAYVVAESKYGNARVAGRVRASHFGYEVQLPGGTWIDCGMSCTETLRVETVDFWENKGAGRERSDRAFGLFDYVRPRKF